MALFGLGVFWLAYFALHSMLASLKFKGWVAKTFPAMMPAYRLVYNGLAIILLLPGIGLMFQYPGATLWVWQGPAAWAANGLALAAFVVLFFYENYVLREFLGVIQWQNPCGHIGDQAQFRLSSLHRFVRHPWYTVGLLLIWTRDMNQALLISNLAITLYFIFGARLEEQKLIVYHGDLYRAYQGRVPGLVPLPWKWLSRDEANELLKKNAQTPRIQPG